MILVLVAVVLLVGASSGLLWWKLASPGWEGSTVHRVVGFDAAFSRPIGVPPRPDEGVEWIEEEVEPVDGWGRTLAGLVLAAAVAVAASALAAGLYTTGKYLFHQLITYFGSPSL